MRREIDGIREFVTVEKARWYIEHCRYPRNRLLDWETVLEYALEYAMDEFARSTLRFHQLGDTVYNTDGNHRLHAIPVYGEGQWFDIQTTVCDSMKEIDEDYARMGDGRLRTVANRREALQFAETLKLGRADTDSVLKAVGVVMSGFATDSRDETLSRDKALRRVAAEELKVAARLYFEATKKTDRTIGKAQIRNRVLVAVGMLICREQPLRGAEFFKHVSEFTGRPGEGTHALSKLLASREFHGARRVVEFSRHIAQCWNHYFSKAELRETRLSQSELIAPLRLLGTSYDGQTTRLWVPEDWRDVVARLRKAA